MLGGRSANRGMCAQPCRLPMRYEENDHALSLKDNGSLHYLRKLQEMGIASAKIEGRMKRPEYVAAATLAAREARDLGFITEVSQERLRSVFSRTGFTDGYLRGEIGEEMFGFRQKSDVVSADNQLLKEIRVLYKDEYHSVPVSFDCHIKTGEKMRLTATDGVHTVKVESDEVAEKALHGSDIVRQKVSHTALLDRLQPFKNFLHVILQFAVWDITFSGISDKAKHEEIPMTALYLPSLANPPMVKGVWI
jgi:putative protease